MSNNNSKNNIDIIRTDFMEIYTRSVLEDLGVALDDMNSQKLFDTIKHRINARVYLEMVAMLTPEQAALVARDINSEHPDPEATIQKTLEKIPDFAPRLAVVLGKIRSELLEDLKPLVAK